MSVDASIDIQLHHNNDRTITVGQIVTALVDYGWRVEREGGICYSILDAAHDYHAFCEPLTLKILAEKLETLRDSCRLLSVEITWQNTEIGGPLRFYGNSSTTTCNLGLQSDRQRLPADNWYGMTNFQWY